MNINDFEKGSVIMMSGDSVTDVGRGRPEGNYLSGLGGGYVNRIHEIVTACMPERRLKFVNMGISGETSRDVVARWKSDLERVKPDYATLMIGVNDVWRSYDTYLDPDRAVDAAEYERNIRSIIEASASLKGFMLISPIFFELNKQDLFMSRIAEYSSICRRLAAEYGIDYLDLQPEIDRLCGSIYAATFAPDRVHPSPVAHAAVARAVLKAMSFEY